MNGPLAAFFSYLLIVLFTKNHLFQVRNSSELICEGKLRVYYANRKLKAETVDRYVSLVIMTSK